MRRVYPMIFYTGYKPYNYSTDIFDLFQEDKKLAQDVFLKPYQLINLNQIPDQEFKEHLEYGVIARVMKHIYEKDILPWLKNALQDLKTLENQGETNYIYTILSYLVEASEVSSKKEFIETIKTGLSSYNEEKVMNLAAQFRREGIKIGIEQGMEQGMEQGIEQGMERGLEKGKVETAKLIAKKLLNQGMDIKYIAACTELPLQVIKMLNAASNCSGA